MALDGNFIAALKTELNNMAQGKINKIAQINDTTLLLKIRANRKNHQLLISAHPMYARVHITDEKYDNPFDPPTFLRVLRKHIDGGIITDIKQIRNDRILEFHINSRNELQDDIKRILIVEIMGRHSNIVLTDENYKILDGIKHLTPNNNARTIMPGVDYELPPTKEKLNPKSDEIDGLLKHIDFNAGKIDKQIMNNVEGLSPVFVKEMKFMAGHFTSKDLIPVLKTLVERSKNVTPVLYETNDKSVFYFTELEHIDADPIYFESLSELLDEYYTTRYRQAIVKQKSHDYYQIIEREFDRTKRKLDHLYADLDATKDKDLMQKYGELLTAYMHEVEPHKDSVNVFDYYTNENIDIPLDKQKSPNDNAQKYYRLYNKLKKREVALDSQLKNAKRDIEYFENLLHQMDTITTEDEVDEIREELIEEGIIRRRVTKNGKKKPKGLTLHEYKTTGGITVWVGKNNKQNDYLTNKKAAKNHVWFHTKDIPGSHVVIASPLEEVSEQDLMDAAIIAAFFSKASSSESVPVDFTEIKNVSKISGAKPGFVTYKDQKTLFVTPEKRYVESMRVSE